MHVNVLFIQSTIVKDFYFIKDTGVSFLVLKNMSFIYMLTWLYYPFYVWGNRLTFISWLKLHVSHDISFVSLALLVNLGMVCPTLAIDVKFCNQSLSILVNVISVRWSSLCIAYTKINAFVTVIFSRLLSEVLAYFCKQRTSFVNSKTIF